MKGTLQAGLTSTKHIAVDEGRSIGFMGMVYATPRRVLGAEARDGRTLTIPAPQVTA